MPHPVYITAITHANVSDLAKNIDRCWLSTSE